MRYDVLIWMGLLLIGSFLEGLMGPYGIAISFFQLSQKCGI